jgi:lysozyme family protein
MAKSNFTRSIDLVLQHEGGYTANPKDPGNWTGGKVGKGVLLGTKYGIAANTFPDLDIKNLTKAQARAIYKKNYWDKISGDDLPCGLDYCIADYAVNSGVARAAKEAQRAAGMAKTDGVIAAASIRQIEALPPAVMINRVCDQRLTFLRGLKTWATFGKGWTKRVNDVRRIALKMTEGEETPKEVDAVNPGRADRAVVADRSVSSAAVADGESASQTATGVGAVGSAVTEAAGTIEPLSYYMDWAQYIFLGLTVVGIGITIWLMVKRKRQEA